MSEKVVFLIFPADSAFEGATPILNALEKNDVKASFFLTGNCLRNQDHRPVIERIIANGHYLGGHSDKHILYAGWDNRDSLLVSADSLIADFRNNMRELADYGVDTDKTPYYLPPYEWYNKESVRIVESLGQITINYTPGIRTAADYTISGMKNYMSSQSLLDSLYQFEKDNGLDGCLILIHPGTHHERTDKFYNYLDDIIKNLKKKGYRFDRL